MTRFGADFLIGTATSAHQVEGDNTNSDWWAWETAADSPCAEPSGRACDHWNRFEQDIALLASAGLRAYRFSVEWARVEPTPGRYSREALDHYRQVVDACLALGVAPIVTLHHFTLPQWVAQLGGWSARSTAALFGAYARQVAELLAGDAAYVCTLNEINMIPAETYLWTGFPPGLPADPPLAAEATDVVLAAHRAAVDEVKRVSPETSCGMTLALAELAISRDAVEVAEEMRALVVRPYLETAKSDDFVGVQSYSRVHIGPSGILETPAGLRVTQMGWEYRPEALEATLRDVWTETGGLPMLVTENGIATDDDVERIAYTRAALDGVARCLADGLDVRAYLHWSLLDNFEWRHGYRPTFGLVSVDRTTFARTPKPSLGYLGAIARTGLL